MGCLRMKNEKRLIDANKAKAVLVNMAEHLLEAGNPEMAGAVGYAAEVIGKQKTVDAVEVVHGRWHKPTPCSQEFCTNCGLTPKTNFGWLPPYCPNCGVKMDGGNEDV